MSSKHRISYQEKRTILVKRHVIPSGVTDERVIKALMTVPRHWFVAQNLRDVSYLDMPLSIGFGQTISQPSLVGLMTQLLKLTGEEKVLEVGTGSGYQTALLSLLARHVHTIERIAQLAKRAAQIFKRLKYKNITVVTGDGSGGLPQYKPYDAIIVTAAAKAIPRVLTDQLNEGGRIVMPVGEVTQHLIVGVKRTIGIHTMTVEPVRFVPLVGTYGLQTH